MEDHGNEGKTVFYQPDRSYNMKIYKNFKSGKMFDKAILAESIGGL